MIDDPTKLAVGWKPLSELSTALAEELHTAIIAASVTLNGSASFKLGPLPPVAVAAQSALLADLTRPASRDFWARWLAEKVGLAVGATAPSWFCQDYGDGPFWTLATTGSEWVAFSHAWPAWQDSERRRTVETMFGIADPAAALRAALLAVEPA